MAGKSLSVRAYTNVVLQKYCQGAFSEHNPEENLDIAADELYVLLCKLRDATGDKSDDFRSPLKCIRNCIDKPDFGTDKSPVEVEDLMFWLLERLEGLCTERAHAALAARDGPAAGAAPGDREAAQTILEALRYRLTRLVTGDAWDAKPVLKLRVLRLMHTFLARDNERFAAESGTFGRDGGEAPRLKLTRQISWGRRQAAVAATSLAPPRSKWEDAFAELGKMPGAKLLPLMKLLLAENLELLGSLAAGGGVGAAAPSPAPAPAPRREPAGSPLATAPRTPPQASLKEVPFAGGHLDDLLGLAADAPSARDDQASGRSSSPAPSSAAAPVEELFAALSTNSGAAAEPRHQPHHASGPVSIPHSGAATPHSFNPFALPTGYAAPGSSAPNAAPLAYPPPSSPLAGAYGSAPWAGGASLGYGGGASPPPGHAERELFRNYSPPRPLGSGEVDYSSPYLGNPRPFADTRFVEVDPFAGLAAGHPRRPPPPPPAARTAA